MLQLHAVYKRFWRCAMDEQLKQLMEYTKFHIGMYTSLATLLIGVLTLDKIKLVKPQYGRWLFVALGFLVIAGMAGGMVGSSIPAFSTYHDFVVAPLGPWGQSWFQASTWVHIEHSAFWLFIVIALLGLGITRLPARKRV
jgi:hypothetical protein